MKLSSYKRVLAAGWVAAAVGLWAGAERGMAGQAPVGAAAVTNNVPKGEFVIPKSVFTDDPVSGKDPFFPTSTRRNPKPPVTNTQATNATATVKAPVVEPPRDPVESLALKGITGSRRLALISGQPFGVGETYVVRTPVGPVKLKCVEIRERSVLIEVEGRPGRVELTLPQNP